MQVCLGTQAVEIQDVFDPLLRFRGSPDVDCSGLLVTFKG